MGIEQVIRIQLIAGKAYGADGRSINNHKGWYYLIPEALYDAYFKPAMTEDVSTVKMDSDLRDLFPPSLVLQGKKYDLDPKIDVVDGQAIIVRYVTLEAEVEEITDEMKMNGELGGD